MKGGKDGDTFVFGGLHNGRRDSDTILDYDVEEFDVIAIRGGDVAKEREVPDGWKLTLEGDGDVVFILGVEDADADGSILDDVLLL